jgi:hypothetical protein
MPRVIRIREMLPDKLGSKLLLRVSKLFVEKEKKKLVRLILVFVFTSYRHTNARRECMSIGRIHLA